MKFLVHLALVKRWFVVGLAFALLMFGLFSVRKAKLDVFPEFSPIIIEIQTECPGLPALETESLITTPIEISLRGLPGLQTVRSKSLEGLSSVAMLFDDTVDIMLARQLAQERLLTLTGRLPSASRAPILLPAKSSLSRILKIGVTSDTLSQVELTTFVRWDVWPRLMAVPGVAHVAIWGQRDRQFQILVDPFELTSQKISLNEVLKATQDTLAPIAGGFIDTPNQRLSVSHTNAVTTTEDLKRLPVAFRNGVSIPLERISLVDEGHQQPIGDAVVNGKLGLLLIVEKQLGANTIEVTNGLETAVKDIAATTNNINFDSRIFRPATFIETAVKNLKFALWLGCFLVGLVLLAFLFDWRTAFISLTAIPLSLGAAAIILQLQGVTFNTMIIAGLAIALGEVVDDAIIDVENVIRRLRLNRLEETPKSAFQVVFDASLEVRSSVVYATLIVALVFIPVLFLGGVAGKFFAPLAISYMIAVLSSLFVALTVTPALCLILLPGSDLNEKEFKSFTKVRHWYRATLPWLMDRTRPLLFCLAGAFVGAGVVFSQLGEEFLPKFKESDFLMHWIGKPGSSLEAMQRTTLLISKDLMSIPEVQSFGAHLGRAEASDEVVGSNFSELWLSLRPGVDYKTAVEKLKSTIASYPGVFHDVLTYLRERIEEVVSGGKGSIVIRLYGDDLKILRKSAQDVYNTLSRIDGIADLQVEHQVEIPHLEIQVRPEAAALGLNAGDIKRTLYPYIHGQKVGEIHENQKTFDVTVWTEKKFRQNADSFSELPIALPNGLSYGGTVALRQVAEVRLVSTPNIIQHEQGSRKIDISLNSKDGNLDKIANETLERISQLQLPPGYHAQLLGEYQERSLSQRRLLFFSLLSLLGIFLVLFLDFQSLRVATLVFFSLPFALLGGVVTSALASISISLGSLVGFVTVLGIAARNAVMLISHYRFLEEESGRFDKELIVRGSEERLRPILMTAAATALGLLPIVIGGDKPGHEIEYPMAVIILGGLVSSTLLNLAAMPALAHSFLKTTTPTLTDTSSSDA